ncbi:hypothetical protein CLAFUW4_08814 [Fulvia fulva]|uniref:Uncharacterized protein n=1 Tax=Passalora fulva TaxID=5499 RepID=A0A9Q8PFM3_PASFU|nr:uncharacterized protein CLAFUR5_08921 [Fulvia fulva]KAK4613243.1 hypothetical protein CLAFUR4_08820 [Fulvia fulva]KAK4614615.1 hypothetical protein CLAFUR0_08812 [Fulvia fulva]UJO21545.1 hypothetical protein CLAFUR5_08921 [Fulvia fulva]WPV20220.1 hypothetical protein CLAFUW4_08814 [Fulvia fulva]WPV35538.1 hypothetical protein CLAFUW7_08815 [Fulvia fulva]
MTTATLDTNCKKIFPFFRLPRELRDSIYEECDGSQDVSLSGPKDDHLQAWVEGGFRINLLLVSKQFSDEYQERQRGNATLMVDMTATSRSYTFKAEALDELRARAARPPTLLSGPRRLDDIEARLPALPGCVSYNIETSLVALSILFRQMRKHGDLPKRIKVYIQNVGIDGLMLPTLQNFYDQNGLLTVQGGRMIAFSSVCGEVNAEIYSQLRDESNMYWQGDKDGVSLIGTWTTEDGWKAVA